MKILVLTLFLFCSFTLRADECKKTSHLMIGPGAFDVDKSNPKPLLQVEYRWDVGFRNVRPLVGMFVVSQGNFFVCGGCGIDIFLARKVVATPSFAPGVYYHGGGKKLGFPINFRSAMELAYICNNLGRIGAQFNHISNAGMLWKNPGANSLVIFYAIPI